MKDYNISSDSSASAKSYWDASIKLIMGCLAVWFLVSYVAGIFFFDTLDAIKIGGYPLGFWFAQQGSIYVFVALIFFYAHRMNKIDREHGVHED